MKIDDEVLILKNIHGIKKYTKGTVLKNDDGKYLLIKVKGGKILYINRKELIRSNKFFEKIKKFLNTIKNR